MPAAYLFTSTGCAGLCFTRCADAVPAISWLLRYAGAGHLLWFMSAP